MVTDYVLLSRKSEVRSPKFRVLSQELRYSILNTRNSKLTRNPQHATLEVQQIQQRKKDFQ